MTMAMKTAVLSCVTFETVMVSSPAIEYKADEVHIFHYAKTSSVKADLYMDFFTETVRQIKEGLPNVNIVDHSESAVYDFRLMLRDILACVKEIAARYEDVDILINTSSGTSEFIAAGVIAAMMSKGKASAFTVRTNEFTVKEDDIKSVYYKDGRPVGLSASVKSPCALPHYKIDLPDENLVRGLRLYDELRATGKPVTALMMIENMKKMGIWLYVPSESAEKTDMKQKETMYYQRHFVNTWDELGWIEKPGRKVRFTVSPMGRNIIDTFFID